MKRGQLWLYRGGQPAKKMYVEDFKDVVPEFPTFTRKPTETKTQADARWAVEYPKIAQAIHQYMEAVLCKAYTYKGSIAERRSKIENELQALADSLIAQRLVCHMHPHVTVRTMTNIIEVNLSYRAVSSGSPHMISISPLSPSEQ